MKIIDLSIPIYQGMPVYPGDPEVVVKQQQSFKKDGWNMKRVEMNLHDGTHVNVPIHGTKSGLNLDSYTLEDFVGKCRVYKNSNDLKREIGIIFTDQNIDRKLAEKIVENKPKFVGLSNKFEFDEEIEKYLLANNIISFERLVNTDRLPREFDFYGAPLKIKDGDGSPVRAFAII